MSFTFALMIKSTIILISALFVCAILRQSSASRRCAIWFSATTGLFLLPILMSIGPHYEWPVFPGVSMTVVFSPISTATSSLAGYSVVPQGTLTWNPATSPLVLVMGVWIIGVAVLLTRSLVGMLSIRRLAGSAKVAESCTRISREFSDRLSIARPVRVLFGETNLSPMTWGLLHHTILLPPTANEWSEERLRVVLAHEMAHVRRNDGMTQIVVQLVCSLYWFNPLVWYAAHRIRIERERACDDHVLRLGMTATDYAEHLVQIVRTLRPSRDLSYAAVSMAQPSQLEKRLVAILNPNTERRPTSIFGIAILSSVVLLLTISIAGFQVAGAVPMPPLLSPATRAAEAPQRTRIGNGGAVPNNAVTAPRVIESTLPAYTDEALAARVEGTVTLEADVSADGKVKVLRVVKRLGYGLDEKAISTVLEWKFGPARRNGTPVKAITLIDVDFQIPVWFKSRAKESEAVRVGPGVTPPQIISRIEPKYPEELKAAKIQGTVVVEATIHKDGTLTVNKVVREPEPALTPSAIEALEQWKFKPGMRNGEPVDVALTIEVNFNLK